MKTLSLESKFNLWVSSWLKGYNHAKYWRRRAIVIDPYNKTPLLIKLYYLCWIKRVDAKFCCSFGTNLNNGSRFKTPPILPHGPYGIICGHDWSFGSNCIIYHQTTFAGGGTIGDNCMIGAGAKILNGVTIGDNVKVGMNAIVIDDIQSDSTVVLSRPRILHH